MQCVLNIFTHPSSCYNHPLHPSIPSHRTLRFLFKKILPQVQCYPPSLGSGACPGVTSLTKPTLFSQKLSTAVAPQLGVTFSAHLPPSAGMLSGWSLCRPCAHSPRHWVSVCNCAVVSGNMLSLMLSTTSDPSDVCPFPWRWKPWTLGEGCDVSVYLGLNTPQSLTLCVNCHPPQGGTPLMKVKRCFVLWVQWWVGVV